MLKIVAAFFIAGPATEFFKAFASEAGKDSYGALRQFVRDLTRSKRQVIRVMLSDDETKVRVLLSDDLPDEAVRQLFNLRLQEFAGAYATAVTWLDSEQRWTTQAYPAMRTDVFGWYDSASSDERAPTSHVASELDQSPVVTLCGVTLSRSTRTDRHAQPCHECIRIAEKM